MTSFVSPKTKVTNSVAPKNRETPLRLRVEKVNSDISPRMESTSESSQSSSNSTLVGDRSSYSSKASHDSASLTCRIMKRLSGDPAGVYSPQKVSLEGLTIECQKSFESDEGQVDTERRRDTQPASSQQPKRTNPPPSTKRKEIYSNSSQKPQPMYSQTSVQEFNGKNNGQRWKSRQDVQALSSQPANTTNKPIARKHQGETTFPLVTQQKFESGWDTNNWFTFDELDENGFPTNHFRVDGKEKSVKQCFDP